jgi:hypothetical protein
MIYYLPCTLRYLDNKRLNHLLASNYANLVKGVELLSLPAPFCLAKRRREAFVFCSIRGPVARDYCKLKVVFLKRLVL